LWAWRFSKTTISPVLSVGKSICSTYKAQNKKADESLPDISEYQHIKNYDRSYDQTSGKQRNPTDSDKEQNYVREQEKTPLKMKKLPE
jgi:hypothetical protein